MADSKKTQEKSSFAFSSLKNILTLNIGSVIFGALFLYLLVSLILYLTASHVASYQVTSGPLERNQTYTGLALRAETVQNAESSGYVTYYARDASKVKKDGIVYTLGEKKNSDNVQPAALSGEELEKIRSAIADFADDFSPYSFNSTYRFKYTLEGSILQYRNEAAEGSDTISADETPCVAQSDGLVIYNTDGYENLDYKTISEKDFDQKQYEKNNLKMNKVSIGDPVFKLIGSEEWSLIIPLSEKQSASLESWKTKGIRVKFLKDGATQVGSLTVFSSGQNKYGKIDFTEGMIRYATDRFVDVELVTNTETGLKIPVSSIVKKNFFTIPKRFKSEGGNQTDAGFLKETTTEDGKTETTFVDATVYKFTNDMYCVDTVDFKKGDQIVKADSTDRYTIDDTISLQGVYCINKGYAVFRQISFIDKDEEYCIVKAGEDYSISQFDHIVLNGKSVKEEDIVY